MDLSIAGVTAWQQQNLGMQVGISVLQKSMHGQEQSAMALLESATTATSAVSAPALIIYEPIGQNIDLSV